MEDSTDAPILLTPEVQLVSPSLDFKIPDSSSPSADRIAAPAQLTIPLPAQEPFSLSFFVAHSGVAQALSLVLDAVRDVRLAPSEFRAIFLWGPEGVGKSHLIEGAIAQAKRQGIAPEQISVFDLTDEQLLRSLDRDPERFIYEYERVRSGGGLLLTTSRQSPDESSRNPHLLSRFRAGSVEELSFAREEELQTVLEALFERRNLRVSSKTLDFMIRRLPSDPLSFHRIVAKIDGFVWAEGGTPSVHTIKRVLLSEAARG